MQIQLLWSGNRPLYSAVADANNYTGIVYLTNTSEGYTYNLTAKLEKDFDFGLTTMVAHTLGESKGVNDGTSSQALSNWSYNETFLGNDFDELAYTDFDVRHRIVGSLGYKVEYANHFATSISLFYNGQSGSRYSLLYTRDVNGDTYNNDVIYIPTDAELAQMTFSKDEQKHNLQSGLMLTKILQHTKANIFHVTEWFLLSSIILICMWHKIFI